MGVLARLFLADKGIELLGFRLQDSNGEASFIHKEIINKTIGGLLEVVAEIIEGLFLEFDGCFKAVVGGAGLIVKEAPVRPPEKVVDQNPCSGFLVHSRFFSAQPKNKIIWLG